jgi:ABC-type Na+ efflux pump permease subunit
MTASAAPVPPALATRDFADWLSPMLVKELRQGMRSRVFVICFLVLQLAMLFLAIVGLTASTFDSSPAIIGGFFWAIVATPLLLVMPVTGLTAIGGESRADTLELIFLTRLTARRIIFGKWIALVAQSLLLVAAVLPYAVLRYFLGGIDFLYEMQILGVLTFSSAVLTAIAVGLSPLPNKLMRLLMILAFVGAVIFVGGSLVAVLFNPFSSFFGSAYSWDWKNWLAGLVAPVGVMAFMLEVGAAKLAPAAENHTTPMRLIALGMGLLTLAFQR